MPRNLEKLWEKTNFDESCEADRFIKHLLRNGKSQQLVEMDPIELPSYYDRELFKRGQKFYNDHRYMITIGSVAGVVILLAVESILDILVCTRQSSTSKTAYRRYAETIFYVQNFYHDFPEDKSSRSYKSLVGVRGRHRGCTATSMKKDKGFINQRDMAITQFGFFGFVMARNKTMGIPFDEEGMAGFIHLWRVVGYCLGIKEEFNLCGPDLKTTIDRCDSMLKHVITPAMIDPPPDFQSMFEALINGLWYLDPNLNVEKFHFSTMRLCRCPGYFMTTEEKQYQINYLKQYPHYAINHDTTEKALSIEGDVCQKYKDFGWYDRIDLSIVSFVIDNLIYKSSLWRMFFNFTNQVRVFFLEYFPYLAIFKFGFKHAYVPTHK